MYWSSGKRVYSGKGKFPRRARARTAKGRYALGYPGYKSRRMRAIGRSILTFPETKYFDTGIQASITYGGDAGWTGTEVPCDNYVNTSGAVAAYTDSCLIPTAIGSGYGQVIGSAYKLKKLRIRGLITLSTTTAGTAVEESRVVRLLLVMDTSPCGAQAQGEDIIQDVGAAAENLFSFKRMPTTPGRFRILKDKIAICNPATSVNNAGATTVSNSFNTAVFKMQYSPRLPIHVNIATTSSTPTVASVVSHNIFLLMAAVETGAAPGAVVSHIAASSRCYYCD